MAEDSKDMTFICASRMHKYIVMLFGLINSASSYNHLMRKVLEGSKHLESYVDDVLAHTEGWNKHVEVLRDFFERVRRVHLKLKQKKCSVGYGLIDFLGHTIKGGEISPREESITKISAMPRSRTKKQIRSFLEAVNYYRKFIPQGAELVAPLSDQTWKKLLNEAKWKKEQEESFLKLKEALSKAPVLKLPDL